MPLRRHLQGPAAPAPRASSPSRRWRSSRSPSCCCGSRGAPSYTMLTSGPRSRPDRQGHGRARRAGHRLRAAQQRHRRSPSRRARSPRRASRSPARASASTRGSRRGLRAVRQAEARRLRLPAAGHLPARAGGRDRPHDRQRRGRHEPAGAARAARGRPVRRRGDARPRPRSCSATRPTRSSRRAARGIAQLVASSVKGLKTDNVTITDASGALLWPAGDGSGARRRGRRQAGARGALLARHGGRPQRAARPHARRGQGPGVGHRRPERGQDHARRGHVREEGRRRSRRRPRPRSSRAAAPPPAAPRAPARTSRPTRPARPAAARTRTTSARPRTPTSASARRSPRTEVAPGAVNKINVALLVDKSVPAADFAAVQQAVASAAGHRHHARRRDAGRAGAVRQGRDAEGRPGADDAARPAQVGRRRLRRRCCSCSS